MTALYLTDPSLSDAEIGESPGIPVGSIGPTRALPEPRR